MTTVAIGGLLILIGLVGLAGLTTALINRHYAKLEQDQLARAIERQEKLLEAERKARGA